MVKNITERGRVTASGHVEPLEVRKPRTESMDQQQITPARRNYRKPPPTQRGHGSLTVFCNVDVSSQERRRMCSCVLVCDRASILHRPQPVHEPDEMNNITNESWSASAQVEWVT